MQNSNQPQQISFLQNTKTLPFSCAMQTSYYASAARFIDSLWVSGFKRLMIVRVDFLIREEYQPMITIFQMKDWLHRLWFNRRCKPSIFEHCIGWVWGMEYTEECHYHAHGLFVFDADHVQADVYYADLIGQYWINNITGGVGVYHNCNRYNKGYRNSGIGRVCVDDLEKRRNLMEIVIPYLAKDDPRIRAAMRLDEAATGYSTKGIRTFGCTTTYQ